MVLPMSMSVHEMQCGSLVHFCMVNLGYEKSGHRGVSKNGGFELAQIYCQNDRSCELQICQIPNEVGDHIDM